ncbi:MAG: hypothetical protein K2J80_04395, partial [Oscillospiraceae bacterium]|nr:hypothetical protein [Oscillospiraceae bacterium]
DWDSDDIDDDWDFDFDEDMDVEDEPSLAKAVADAVPESSAVEAATEESPFVSTDIFGAAEESDEEL